MPDPNEKYSYIDNVSEEECYEKWEGNDWVADDNNPEVGVCESNFDFDAFSFLLKSNKKGRQHNETYC
ncbi:hypothetical protein JYQ62_33610 [Nostoc sp. UHCC 0702]|nr:hypothetical protein JYQ62_33610 [Nostoc sp. UHCC 0702]